MLKNVHRVPGRAARAEKHQRLFAFFTCFGARQLFSLLQCRRSARRNAERAHAQQPGKQTNSSTKKRASKRNCGSPVRAFVGHSEGTPPLPSSDKRESGKSSVEELFTKLHRELPLVSGKFGRRPKTSVTTGPSVRARFLNCRARAQGRRCTLFTTFSRVAFVPVCEK